MSEIGHVADSPAALRDVRSRGKSGKHLIALSFFAFDPNAILGCSRYRSLQRLHRLMSAIRIPDAVTNVAALLGHALTMRQLVTTSEINW